MTCFHRIFDKRFVIPNLDDCNAARPGQATSALRPESGLAPAAGRNLDYLVRIMDGCFHWSEWEYRAGGTLLLLVFPTIGRDYLELSFEPPHSLGVMR